VLVGVAVPARRGVELARAEGVGVEVVRGVAEGVRARVSVGGTVTSTAPRIKG
jgi:hypothetical protein